MTYATCIQPEHGRAEIIATSAVESDWVYSSDRVLVARTLRENIPARFGSQFPRR